MGLPTAYTRPFYWGSWTRSAPSPSATRILCVLAVLAALLRHLYLGGAGGGAPIRDVYGHTKALVVASRSAHSGQMGWLDRVPEDWDIYQYISEAPPSGSQQPHKAGDSASPDQPSSSKSSSSSSYSSPFTNPFAPGAQGSGGAVLPDPHGNEAMAYLTYIINHYAHLPDVVFFHHDHLRDWHQGQDALFEVANLRTAHVARNGYVSARCLSGCENVLPVAPASATLSLDRIHTTSESDVQLRTLLEAFLENGEETWEDEDGEEVVLEDGAWGEGRRGESSQNREPNKPGYAGYGDEDEAAAGTASTSTPPGGQSTARSARTHHRIAKVETVPDSIAAPCCAQFAASRDAIRSRSLAWWKRLRQWLADTPLSSYHSGRLIEYTWHIWLGEGALYCSDSEEECMCKVYGVGSGCGTFL